MVLQKRPEYESSGYHVPSMPHIPRSARGKRSVRRKVEDNQMCAFDLLATVAGKLLSERDNDVSPCTNTHGLTSSPTSGKDDVKEMRLKNFFKDEAFDQQIIRCHDIGRPSSESVLRSKEIDFGIKEDSFASKVPSSKLDYSVINAKPDKKGKDADEQVDEVPAVVGAKIENATDPVISSLPEKCSTSTPKQLGLMTPVQAERKAVVDDGMNERPQDHMSTSTSKDSMDLDTKHPALVSSENSVELVPVYMNHEIPPSSSFPKLEDGMELFIDKADDVDENCSRCTHPTILSSGEASRPQRIGYRRIRKLLASKYWKVAPPPMSQDNELSDYNHVDMKSAFCSKKLCYTRQRTQRGPFKRKKLFEQCSMSMGETYRECLSNLCEKGSIKKEANASHETLCEASGSPSSVTGQKSSHDQRDYHVKVNIKSFRVPELFIEIPETATVGSLKRTVMEAVTAILGGGLRVGVLLHGKKIRDDNKTLSQAGISHTDKLDNLGFTLEPKPTQTSVQTTSEEPHFFNLADPSARINPCNSPSSLVDEGNTTDAAATPQLVLATCPDQGGHDSMHSQLVDKAAMVNNSRALVVVPPANDVEALAVVPLRKPRRSEVAQRRIRRPFTVAEVEALVQTVEKLGTGRWRDVKLRAFDNAKHRTYVDLKDKWKTLVHTARISPQQRRGEPVPQELLDRVLSAHAYWSQQQAKLQIKPPPVDTCNLLI